METRRCGMGEAETEDRHPGGGEGGEVEGKGKGGEAVTKIYVIGRNQPGQEGMTAFVSTTGKQSRYQGREADLSHCGVKCSVVWYGTL